MATQTTLVGCSFTGNTANFSTASFNDSYYGSYTYAMGGAVLIQSSAVSIQASNFTSNTASSTGAAWGGSLCLSPPLAGAVRFANLTSCVFIENSVKGKEELQQGGVALGGALFGIVEQLVVQNTSFHTNKVTGGYAAGGALYQRRGPAGSAQQPTLIVGSTLANNKAEGAAVGGAVAVDDAVPVVVVDSWFTSNAVTCPQDIPSESVSEGGAIAACNVTIIESRFVSNRATNRGGQSFGGAVSLSPQCSLQVHHSSFVANEVVAASAAGGALFLPGSVVLTMSDSSLTHNTASGGQRVGSSLGGAVYYAGGDGLVSNTNFTHNRALPASATQSAGGAVYSQGTLDVVASTFQSNEAYVGGAFALSSNTNTTAIACRFEQQSARHGGAVHFDCATTLSTLLVASSVFTNNHATAANGGAILLEGRSHCQTTVFDSTFAENTAAANGGAIALSGCIELSVHSATFEGQQAAQYAGALSIESPCDMLHTVSQSSFTNNTAQAGGGAIALRAGFLHVDTCNVTENSAGAGGGIAVHAVRNDTCNCTIQDTLFANNCATTNGGAVSVDGCAAVDVRLSIFFHHHAGVDGGAISVASTCATVSSLGECSLSENSADRNGGSIVLASGGLLVDMCNFTDNSADQFGGGVYTSLDTILSWQAGECRNNSAQLAGGMVYFEIADPQQQLPQVDCSFGGNTALYGNDASSSPVELIVNITTPTAGAAEWIVWPGRLVGVWAELRDWFHNTVIASTSLLQLTTTPSSSVSLIVQCATVAPNTNGLYSVSNMSFLGNPMNHSTVDFSLTYATAPQLQFADSVNVTLAFCPPGYFLVLEGDARYPFCSKCSSTEYSFNGKASCKRCPHNGDAQTSCIDSEWTNGFTLKPGYWVSLDGSQPDSLIACPRSESCKQIDCWYNLTSSLDWDVHCSAPRCETGYTDRLCTRCECSQDSCWFASSTDQFTCENCGGFTTKRLAGVLVSVLVSLILLLVVRKCAALVVLTEVVLTVVLVLLELESWLMFDIILVLVLLYFLTRRQVSTGVVKSVLFYLQTFGAIVSSQLFPSWLPQMQQLLSVFNLHLFGLECFSANTALRRTLFFLLLPLVLVLLAVLLITSRFLLSKLRPIKWLNKRLKQLTACTEPAQPKPTLQAHDAISTLDSAPLISTSEEVHTSHVHKSTKLRYELLHSILFILFTAYFGVTNTALGILQPCDSQGYMTAYPWISCNWSDEYRWLVAIAAVAICVYTVAVPALFLGLLIGKRRAIIGKDVHVHYWMGMLFEGYRHEVYWWEMVWLARRLALSLVLNLVPVSLLQVRLLLISLVLIVSILALSYMQPREQSMENYVEMASLVCLLLDTLAVQIVASSPSSGNLAFVRNAVITWNVLIILAFVVALFIPFCIAGYKRRRRKRIASLTAL